MPVMTQTTRHLTYRGNPAAVSMLVQMADVNRSPLATRPHLTCLCMTRRVKRADAQKQDRITYRPRW